MEREQMIKELVNSFMDSQSAVEQFIRESYKDYTDEDVKAEYKDIIEE